jgi:hypothetical protein
VPSDKSKSPLVLEFNRKLQAALQLSQDDVGREAKRMYNVAFLPYKPLDLNATLSLEPALKLARLSSASKFRALEDVLLVPDADDPERSKAIEGRDLRQRIDGALSYYRDVLLARLKPIFRENFKPVAQVAAQLIAAGFAREVEQVHGTTGWVIHDHKHNRDWINSLHGYYGRPDLTMSFVMAFQDMFTDLWCRLVLQAELEGPSQASMQTMPFHGDARSRALANESGVETEKEESPEERRRREVICAAVKLKKQGVEYCKYLDGNGLRPSLRLQASGCPATYAEGYKKFKKSFWKEKTRIVNESAKRSRTKPTIH